MRHKHIFYIGMFLNKILISKAFPEKVRRVKRPEKYRFNQHTRAQFPRPIKLFKTRTPSIGIGTWSLSCTENIHLRLPPPCLFTWRMMGIEAWQRWLTTYISRPHSRSTKRGWLTPLGLLPPHPFITKTHWSVHRCVCIKVKNRIIIIASFLYGEKCFLKILIEFYFFSESILLIY